MTDKTNRTDNHLLQRQDKRFEGYTESFGELVSLGTTNEADLASHYDYSPERYRVFVDGTRQEIIYNGEPAQFSDNVDSFSLLPQTDGEVVTLKTAERYRYVVQYVLEWSIAFQTNQDLQAGDVWAIGYGNPDLENSTDDTPGPNADGWFVYQNSNQAKDVAILAEYRDGTAVDTFEIDLVNLPGVWGRLAGRSNWYNVGETSITESYMEKDSGGISQENDTLGTVGVVDGKGPTKANHPITLSVKAGAGAGSLELEGGSIGVRTFGQVTGILRTKAFDYELSYTGTTGEFEPLLAIRVDPERFKVNTQFTILEPLKFSASDDLVLIAQIFDKGNVLDGNGNVLTDANFSTPIELSDINSVIQTSSDVEQVPDATGTIQTSMPDPGGYQVGYGSLTSTGSQGSSSRVSSRARTQKRAIPNGDIAVIMARSNSTGTVNGDVQFEQDW
jgi:hypothetical protein